MIRELVQYADSIAITGREAFRARPVHWIIDLDEGGHVLGFTPTCAATSSKKGGTLVERRGKRFLIPANYLLGSPNQNNWRPAFLTGPAEEIFSNGVEGTNSSPKKSQAFRELMDRAAESLPENMSLKAVREFLQRTQCLAELPLPESACQNLGWFRKRQNAAGDTLGFRVAGVLLTEDKELRTWWECTEFASLYAERTAECRENGEDGFQPGTGRITASSPCVFGNVPLVSFNNDPFCSFGRGTETARLRLDTAEKAAAALNALRQDGNTSLTLGDEKAIFWAIQDNAVVDCSFIALLESSDPLAVSDFLQSVWGSAPREVDRAAFHVAILKEGTGRFSVRSWHIGYLGDVDRRVRGYFDAIRLPIGPPVNLGSMARSTIQKTKREGKTKPATLTYNALFETAWRGAPLPSRILGAALSRQCAELAKGRSEEDKTAFEFRLRARTALIKLYFYANRKEAKDKPMNEHNHDRQNHPAYLCGRILALLEEIHSEAHGKATASSPADRYYGSASSTPALVFPRLCKLARIHLAAIRKDPKRGWRAPLLDKDLSQLIAKFNEGAAWPRMLSMEDQGRFAIGFYYERSPKPGEQSRTESQTSDSKFSSTPDA